MNKPVYCIPGNHDDPELLSSFYPNTPVNTVTSITHNEFLIIFVNTQVKDRQYGYINENNLNEISELLDKNTGLNAVIVLHHPPVLISSEWMDKIGLKNGKSFLKSLENHKNLKLILFGHVHQEINTTHQHIQIYATPSTCYQFKPKTETMQYDKLSAAYRLVKISNNGTIESQVYRVEPS